LLIVDARLRQRAGNTNACCRTALSPSNGWRTMRALLDVLLHRRRSAAHRFPADRARAADAAIADFATALRRSVLWLRMPFLDTDDLFAGAGIEALIREGHKLEFSAASLGANSSTARPTRPRALAARLRQGLALLGEEGTRCARLVGAPAGRTARRRLAWLATAADRRAADGEPLVRAVRRIFRARRLAAARQRRRCGGRRGRPGA
jgi:hypothetical protein